MSSNRICRKPKQALSSEDHVYAGGASKMKTIIYNTKSKFISQTYCTFDMHGMYEEGSLCYTSACILLYGEMSDTMEVNKVMVVEFKTIQMIFKQRIHHDKVYNIGPEVWSL